jgi:L-rhamnose mutarotase
MPRYAFHLRVKADKVKDYEDAHRAVWPDLLQVIKDAGVHEYSIFRRDRDLFFYLHADDFERAWSEIEKSEINTRWQKEMEPLFDTPPSTLPGERFPMMGEVFFLE